MSLIIYEVNLKIEPEIASEFVAWLKQHVRDMLQIPGFKSAEIFQEESNEPILQLCVKYHVGSREELEDYFKILAPSMRAQGIEKFGQLFKASRRILYAIA
ncbi:MAG: DUF4286 family protein [Bdellovibrionales bacterium]|nr:DUF4286 family protein [Bdellovibrionales bacterium]